MTAPIATLVLAGSRPGQDPLLDGTDLSTKALLPIAGRPMLAWVLAALDASPSVGAITVVAQDTAPLAADAAIAAAAQVQWRDSAGSIADAVQLALANASGPLFVTTADNVLLTRGMIEQFLAEGSSSDVAVGLVERQRVAAAGHSTTRTWLRFRGGAWSGANLFRLDGPKVTPLIDFWRGLEQDRKKGLKLIGAFGPGLLLGAALRLIDIQTFANRVAARFGLLGKVVSMDAAEACIDADKPSDLPVIEAIMARRASSAARD
ncbi:2-C-methyl-D-erythritol 4-phosphate cytidylyltransferase [Tsuneonella dongtanensis]|uniref:2-C-methyl-D-erythritol 4-phosphate cytidylyltransferase n=1 Tax=Tsuneonella dongtanensis TaxID=692370 RepID=A0A1B2AFF4_9SPHN|nr:nucleotidyltransferase family protein [Tsuneonella dongtanensis]ANY20765.1 2-C-methyl-D-erythritol 4-phosphate cytidylyltransferase [Tsuneonella dongtanensis]